jgi:site-specific DNA-cytosine methylase
LNASFGDKQGLEDQHALGGGSLFVPSPICMSSGQANAAIAEDKAHTLNATHETQTIVTPIVIDRAAFNQGQNAQYEPHIEQTDVMDSLVARGPHAVLPPAYPINTLTLGGRPDPVNDLRMTMGVGSDGDPQFTLQASHSHAIAVAIAFDAYNQTVSNTCQAVRSAASDVDHVGAVLTPQFPMAVRRLTPTECERLQGFPDNWSQIPWKGKPADQCPDGPRYKCAGNSMAVPVMRWIGEQIARVELSLNNPTK